MNNTKKIKKFLQEKFLQEKFRNKFQVHKRKGSSYIHIVWVLGDSLETVEAFLNFLPKKENINIEKICFHPTII